VARVPRHPAPRLCRLTTAQSPQNFSSFLEGARKTFSKKERKFYEFCFFADAKTSRFPPQAALRAAYGSQAKNFSGVWRRENFLPARQNCGRAGQKEPLIAQMTIRG